MPLQAARVTSTAGAVRVTQSVDAVPNSVGVAAFMVVAWSHRGTTSGQFGYKIGAAARVLAALTQAQTSSTNGGVRRACKASTAHRACRDARRPRARATTTPSAGRPGSGARFPP